MLCKGLACQLPWRPVFLALFIGAAGPIAMSHLPGLPMVAGVAMGIGAMSVVMLTLPLTPARVQCQPARAVRLRRE